MANGSIYNLDNIRKAAKTYNTTAPAPSKATTAAQNVMNNWNKPTQVTGALTTPPIVQAANNVRNGVSSVPSAQSAATAAAQRMVAATSQPRTETALNNVSNLVSTPFSYDAGNDQALQAAIRNAQAQLAVNQKNTNAQLRATGQGKSSYSETVANQLANQTSEAIANDLVPQYAKMAYQQYQDSIANNRNLYQDYYQEDVTRPVTEAQQTGIYQNEAIKKAMNNVLKYKAEAEDPATTAARRMVLSRMASQERAVIDANGGDSSLIGADVNSKNVNTSGIGIRTIQGQQLDLNADNQKFNQKLSTRQQDFTEGTTKAQLTGYMPDGTRTTAEQQRQLTNLWTVAEQLGTIPNELADLYGIARGTQTQSAKQLAAQITNDIRGLDISQQNADTSRYSATNSVDNAGFGQLMDIWKGSGRAPSGLEAYGVAPGEAWYEGAQQIKENSLTPQQVITNIRQLYEEPVYTTTTDKFGKQTQTDTGKTRITTDATKRKQMFDNVVDSGLSSNETMQVLSSLGFSKEEITKLYNEGMQASGGL